MMAAAMNSTSAIVVKATNKLERECVDVAQSASHSASAMIDAAVPSRSAAITAISSVDI
jgi:hypothetical protein